MTELENLRLALRNAQTMRLSYCEDGYDQSARDRKDAIARPTAQDLRAGVRATRSVQREVVMNWEVHVTDASGMSMIFDITGPTEDDALTAAYSEHIDKHAGKIGRPVEISVYPELR